MVGIETGIDKLLDLVQEKKKLTVSEAARKLKVSESKIESWGKVLSDENIIEFTYPANPLNPPFLRAFSKEEVKKKEEGEVPVEKPEKKKYPKRKLRKSKAVSIKFFSRFLSRKNPKKKRNPLPYILLLVAVIVLVMYFTGVIEWLISPLNP